MGVLGALVTGGGSLVTNAFLSANVIDFFYIGDKNMINVVSGFEVKDEKSKVFLHPYTGDEKTDNGECRQHLSQVVFACGMGNAQTHTRQKTTKL